MQGHTYTFPPNMSPKTQPVAHRCVFVNIQKKYCHEAVVMCECETFVHWSKVRTMHLPWLLVRLGLGDSVHPNFYVVFVRIGFSTIHIWLKELHDVKSKLKLEFNGFISSGISRSAGRVVTENWIWLSFEVVAIRKWSYLVWPLASAVAPVMEPTLNCSSMMM